MVTNSAGASRRRSGAGTARRREPRRRGTRTAAPSRHWPGRPATGPRAGPRARSPCDARRTPPPSPPPSGRRRHGEVGPEHPLGRLIDLRHHLGDPPDLLGHLLRHGRHVDLALERRRGSHAADALMPPARVPDGEDHLGLGIGLGQLLPIDRGGEVHRGAVTGEDAVPVLGLAAHHRAPSIGVLGMLHELEHVIGRGRTRGGPGLT